MRVIPVNKVVDKRKKSWKKVPRSWRRIPQKVARIGLRRGCTSFQIPPVC
jgi:hypothetical protein